MADTTKIYENIFIKKNAAGDREYIKVPYAILADPPTIPSAVTSIDGLGGGTLTSPLKITGGDGSGAAKISLNQAAKGQITDSSTSTLFGFMSSNTLTVGGNSYALALRGSGTRPTYKGAELALKSDIPSVPTDYVPNTRKVNNKALSSDITLGASDVGALPTAGGTVTGNLTVGGNLTINGTTTTVGSTTLQVKDKLIEVAHGNTAALTTPAGLVAPKYDGTNSGALVFDSTGTAYVGDVALKDGNIDVANSGLQPLATRTGLVGGNLVQYDSTAQTLKDSGKKISDLATTSQVNAKYTKPSGGIPKTDLASSVQTSLGKADTALQSHQDLSNYVTLNTDQNISGQKKFSYDFGIWANYGFRAFQDEASLNSYTQGVNTIKNSVLTGSGVTVRTDGTSYSAFRDGYIRNQKSGAAINITLPTKEGTFALTSDIPDVSGKLDKTAFEENKTINFGDTGVLKIGKFKVYDTNVTCEITSTTSLTYSGKLVIACQNYIIKKMTVYGDADNTVAPNIFVKPSTTSDPYIEVYFKPPSWSKNVIHIYGSAIAEAPTDVCTNASAVPSTATEKPINALTYLAAGDGGYSLNASGYVKGSWLQAASPTNKGSNTGKVCVFDGAGWIYYRAPSEILSEAGGAKASDVPTITLNGTTTTSPSFWASESGGNIAIGDMATTTGADGVAVGYNSSVTASSGVAIGGVSKVTGASGIAIGSNSSVVTSRSSIAIGYGSSIELASYSIAIGPHAEAHCGESISIGYEEDGPSSTASTHIGTGGYSSSGRALYLGTGRTGFTYMNAAGSSWTSASDIRDKTDIQNIDHALDFIKKLKPITYVMNEREKYLVRDENGNPILDGNGKQQYDVEAHKRGAKKKHRRFAGLSAQDTYQAMLDCYNNNANYAQIVDNNKFDHPDDEYIEQYCMSYERLVPFLIKAMQEQQAQIEKLKSKLGE